MIRASSKTIFKSKYEKLSLLVTVEIKSLSSSCTPNLRIDKRIAPRLSLFAV